MKPRATPNYDAGPEPEYLFRFMQKVEKKRGSFRFPSYIRSAFTTTSGKKMYVCEHRIEKGMLHVYGEDDLQLSPEREEIS